MGGRRRDKVQRSGTWLDNTVWHEAGGRSEKAEPTISLRRTVYPSGCEALTICNGRISTTFKYAAITGVPALSLEPLECEYSDNDLQSVASVSSSASTRAVQERRKISRAEGCFITKQPGYHLERAHWVNAVRKDAMLKFEVVRLMRIRFQSSNMLKSPSIQESLLRDLGIVRQKFLLDAPSNLTPRQSAVSWVVLQVTDY